ncbi:MAG: sugar porter family MFS transporter [Bacteroidales bacterium]|jgi:sugar porter (SP) family MFS transporter|nr:sugar porter family MFS transporter [Bacteroidales bacterium]
MIENKQIKQNKSLVFIIAAIAATGGLLFGFDTGVISGAIPFFQKAFGIDDSWIEIITTAGLVGAVIGAMSSGRITDIVGRKKIILAAAVIFIIGAIWSGAASGPVMLVCARFFLGIAIGVSSFAVPLYIAEISPAKSRGTLVSMFQLLITIGIMVSYLSDSAFAVPDNHPDFNSCWRPMFYVGVIPALIMFIGMIFLPETPRWLISKGMENKCRDVLQKVEEPLLVEEAIERMKSDIEADKVNRVNWTEVFKKWLRAPLIIAVGIMFVQQFTGINTIIYYSPKIFLMSGFADAQAAVWASVSVGIVNVVFTILSLFMIDKLGRRKLYFTGVTGLVIALTAMGICFALQATLGDSIKWVTISLMWIYIGFFAISIGPLGWLIISEVFPLSVRGTGSSIGALSNWLFNGIVAFTFFKLVKGLTMPGTSIVLNGEDLGNPAGAFFLYAIVGIASLVWGYFFIPETKNVTLEKIEEHWRKGARPKDLK